MIQHLHSGIQLTTTRSVYTLLQNLFSGQNQITYLCRDAAGHTHRLIHFQAEAPLLQGAMDRVSSLSLPVGTLNPEDRGEAMGLPFLIFPDTGIPLSQNDPGSGELIRSVLPQLNYALSSLHQSGLLLREITPNTILYDQASRRAFFCEYGNAFCLQGGATATTAAARALSPFFFPPEYPSWSAASDYYALGITLLYLSKGADYFRQYTPQQLHQFSQKGSLPGLDREKLEKTSYSLLSVRQRIEYLILGLTLPDPRQRWKGGEVRAWYHGQAIPLVQTGKKVAYQMYLPFLVGKTPCWDYDQLALALAARGSMDEATLSALVKHLEQQRAPLAPELRSIAGDASLSADGKLFRVIYRLAPNTSGLWWKGTCYQDTAQLCRSASVSPAQLSQMLRDCCFSFLSALRGIQTNAQKEAYARYSQLEAWERAQPGKGANRFIMQMGGTQGFALEGKTYGSLEALVQQYQNRPSALRDQSLSLLKDIGFQSFLWAKGVDHADSFPVDCKTADDAFFLLLSLCEQQSGESGKRLARRLFLNGGAYPHLTWLFGHLSWYRPLDQSGQQLIDQLKRAEWSDQIPLQKLSRNAVNLQIDYERFVFFTTKNPYTIVCGISALELHSIAPLRADAFFSCNDNGIDVTPDFLRTMRLSLPEAELQRWQSDCRSAAASWFAQEKQAVTSTPGYSEAPPEIDTVGSTVFLMVLWLGIVLAAFVISLSGFIPYSLVLAVPAMIFPITGIVSANQQKSESALWSARLKPLQDRMIDLDHFEQLADSWNDVLRTAAPCAIKQAKLIPAFQPHALIQSGNPGIRQKKWMFVLACISSAILPFFGHILSILFCAIFSLIVSLNSFDHVTSYKQAFWRFLLAAVLPMLISLLFLLFQDTILTIIAYIILALIVIGIVCAAL